MRAIDNGWEQIPYEYCERTGKRCYTAKEANEAINHKRRKRIGKKIPKRKYICEFCGRYHLTSKPFHNAKNRRPKVLKIINDYINNK